MDSLINCRSMMEMRRKTLLLFFLLLASIMVNLHAQSLQLAFPFSDNAVIQRDQVVKVWGKSVPNSFLRLNLSDFLFDCIADIAGDWFVEIPPSSEGGPYSLSVDDGFEKKIINDLYFGHVWLCSGQSNMAWTLSNCVVVITVNEIAGANFEWIRILNVPYSTHSLPTYDL